MYVTIYTVQRRESHDKSKKYTHGAFYQTKFLTSMHEHIRKKHPDAKSFERCRRLLAGGQSDID